LGTARLRRALVVEDEAVVAMLIEDLLTDLGYEVVASAATAEQALALAAEADFDFALLDVNLGPGKNSYAAAKALEARGAPYAWLTGYGVQGVPPELAAAPVLRKPIDLKEFEAVVRGLC